MTDKPSDTFQQVGTVTTAGVFLVPAVIVKTPVEYIEKYLIKEVGEIVNAHQELSWVLMMAGIELLGRCVKENVTDNSNNKHYFREGLKLFKSEYQQYNIDGSPHDLYKQLRCGFSHLTFPKDAIVISERGNGGKNMSFTGDGKLVVVAEDFYDDFKEACIKAIDMFKAGTIKPDFHYYGV